MVDHLSLLVIKRAVILVILICSTRYLIVKDLASCFSKNAPPLGRKGKLFVSLIPVNIFLQLFFRRSRMSIPPSGRKGKLLISLSLVNTFFQLFSVDFFDANHSICLRKNKPLGEPCRAFPCGEKRFYGKPHHRSSGFRQEITTILQTPGIIRLLFEVSSLITLAKPDLMVFRSQKH